MDKINNSTNDNKVSSLDLVSLSCYPKMEMMVRKEINNIQNADNDKRIETLMAKYIPKSLSETFKQMSNQEKAKFYNSLADLFKKIMNENLYPLGAMELAVNYYNRALKLDSTNIKNVYQQFELFQGSNPCDKGAEIAELCLKLSNYKDTENKFAHIYSYLGKYFYLNERDYEKSLEQYKKVLDYSDSSSYEYQSSKLYIARMYKHMGDYKKALETINEVKDYEPMFPPELDKERRERFKGMMMNMWHKEVEELKSQLKEKNIKEQEKAIDNSSNKKTEEKINKDDMYYRFKESVGKYSEEVLIEAYKHYMKANSLCGGNTHLKAIEEFKKVKEILPEQTKNMNVHIRMLINENTVSDENKEYYYNYKIQILNEDLEIALKMNNKGELCNIYNELAITYGYLNDSNKNIEYMKKAVDIAGIASMYGLNLANCYELLGLYDEAINIYKCISEKDPSLAERYNTNIDSEILRLNDLKQGKKWGENEQLNSEHSQKGDDYFNNQDFENAFSEYSAAHEIDKRELSYLIKMLMVKEMYESEYLYEMLIASDVFKSCEQKDKIEYLPFLFTICGDYIMYSSSVAKYMAENCYEAAINLLNKVPGNEKFAAPYYKLARIKERQKKYQEAMTLYQFVDVIDKSYGTQKDIDRVRLLYVDDGISNSNEAEKLVTEMEQYLKAKSYLDVINNGKKALEYDPENVKAYYLICKAFEAFKNVLDKKQIYEFKRFAMEGLRATNINYCKVDEEDSTNTIFYWFLGLCCELENKKEQAIYYFDYIIDPDSADNTVIQRKARNEKFYIQNGKYLYNDI